jgi:hypothetical protein
MSGPLLPTPHLRIRKTGALGIEHQQWWERADGTDGRWLTTEAVFGFHDNEPPIRTRE